MAVPIVLAIGVWPDAYNMDKVPSYMCARPCTAVDSRWPAGRAGGACWLLVSGEQQREEDGGWEAGFKLVLRAFRGYRCQC